MLLFSLIDFFGRQPIQSLEWTLLLNQLPNQNPSNSFIPGFWLDDSFTCNLIGYLIARIRFNASQLILVHSLILIGYFIHSFNLIGYSRGPRLICNCFMSFIPSFWLGASFIPVVWLATFPLAYLGFLSFERIHGIMPQFLLFWFAYLWWKNYYPSAKSCHGLSYFALFWLIISLRCTQASKVKFVFESCNVEIIFRV